MADLGTALLGLLQVEQPQIRSTIMHMMIVTGLAMAVVVTALYFVLKSNRSLRDNSATAKLREDFEKSKGLLLAAAQAKRAEAEASAGTEREVSAEDKEKELLRENVEPDKVFGQNCPLSGLEMMEDQELIIDPYTGQGYHFSSFINDWPRDAQTHEELPRPRFVYRYPEDVVLRTADLLRGY
jgi:hypothetical protein